MENALIRILPAFLTGPLPENWDADSPGFVIEVTEPVTEASALLESLASTEPDVLLIDADAPGLDAFTLTQQTLSEYPELAVVIIASDASPERLRRAMVSGAEEYLIRPLEAQDMAAAITAVTSHRTLRKVQRAPEPEAEKKAGLVVGLVSGKGGLGKTTLAANLGIIVAKTPGRNCALVGLESGDGAVLLKLQPKLGLLDLAGTNAVDGQSASYAPEWIKQFSSSHKAGLDYWTWTGTSTNPGAAIPEEFFERLFDTMRHAYSVTIVDFPQISADEAATVMPLLDLIVVVSSSSDLLALRSARTLLDIMPPEVNDRIHMVINRADPTDMISKEDFERTLGRTVEGVIANEARLAAEAINMGAPLVLMQPQSEITGDLKELARSLFDLPVVEEKATSRKRFRLFG